ncbi:uncharacterized protein LOC118348568 [Juglans regia]|uniref:Uncharacterized protein LOC118348568 n=1 Tax=Juglans regia TaxID=51240 RepID=A0A6P9EG31_JUGRE|nr:uncharacterized protein LOC118348568 [Juglans regia]
MGYEFKIEYERGQENKVADALSRKGTEEEEAAGIMAQITCSSPDCVTKLKVNYQQSKEYSKLLEKLMNNKEVPTRVKEIEQQLQVNWEENLEEVHMAVSDLASWRQREAIHLAQMEKLKWKVDGDRNSKFFHACLVNKRRKRVLEMHSNGVVYETLESIHQGVVEYFSSFLQRDQTVEPPRLEQLIDSVISEEENVSLLHAPSIEEVFEALSSIPSQSALGLDGFGSGFYKSCWEVIKVDVWNAVLEFFMSKQLHRFFTASYLVLIPKINRSPASTDIFGARSFHSEKEYF